MSNIIQTYESRLRSLSQPVLSKNLPIKGTVEKELKFWQGKKETSPGAYNRLKSYWDSVGWGTNRWSPSETPWSAAFITYVLRGNNFPGSAAHYAYVENALQGKGGWRAISIPKNLGKIQVSIGDVLVRPRSGSYTNSHGDVVYKIKGNTAYLAGGNLSNTAKGNFTVGLDGNRMLRSAGDYLILLKKNPVYGDGSTLNKILAYGGLTVSLGLTGLLGFIVAKRKGLIGSASLPDNQVVGAEILFYAPDNPLIPIGTSGKAYFKDAETFKKWVVKELESNGQIPKPDSILQQFWDYSKFGQSVAAGASANTTLRVQGIPYYVYEERIAPVPIHFEPGQYYDQEKATLVQI